MTRPLLICGALLFVVAWAAIIFVGIRFDSSATGPAAPEVGGQDNERVEAIEVLYTFDATNANELVGYSDNVFIGEVEDLRGSVIVGTTDPDHPGQVHTRFNVEVVDSIVSGGPEPLSEGDEAVVDEVGGIDPEEQGGEDESRYVVAGVVEGEEYLDTPLQVGEQYIFSTRYWQDVHAVSAQPHGKVALTGPAAETKPRAELVGVFRQAARSPVDPLGADVTGEANSVEDGSDEAGSNGAGS